MPKALSLNVGRLDVFEFMALPENQDVKIHVGSNLLFWQEFQAVYGEAIKLWVEPVDDDYLERYSDGWGIAADTLYVEIINPQRIKDRYMASDPMGLVVTTLFRVLEEGPNEVYFKDGNTEIQLWWD